MHCPIAFFFTYLKVSNFYWPITWEIKQNKIGIKFISKFQSNGITPSKSFPSCLQSLCPMWVQSGIFICCFVLLTLKIRCNFSAKLCCNVIWFVKCMMIRNDDAVQFITIQYCITIQYNTVLMIQYNSLTQCTVEFFHWVIQY